MHVKDNIYIFSGGENDLRLTRNLDTDFICQYNMALYPFDTQSCYMEYLLPLVENDFCLLENDGLSYKGISTQEYVVGFFYYIMIYVGPTELTQYFIKGYEMSVKIIDERRGIQVTIKLGRRLLSTVLTVYLPTFLLNVIGHTTVYFKPYFFEV